jgi:hypothetical protein
MTTDHTETDAMTTLLRTLSAAALLAAAVPAVAQVLLLDVNLNLPLAAVLDNPCTTTRVEAIAMQGSTALAQRVWLMPDGNLRLQFNETTTMSGIDTTALLNPTKYSVAGSSVQDLEFSPLSFSVLQFKKVEREGGADDFHSVLVLSFDPANLRLQVGIEPACDNGMP